MTTLVDAILNDPNPRVRPIAQSLPPNDDPLPHILRRLAANPRLAHSFLFAHRHPDETPDFHYEMIDDWHSDAPFVCTMAFRGGAKSTIAEEAITTLALFRRFRNGLTIGENQPRAVERLTAIKTELEGNERIHSIWGDQEGPIWGESRIELRNGVYLQALGRDQSLRGVKHKDARPDVAFVDDYEDEECVATPEAKRKVRKRFYSVLLPALEPHGSRVRVAGTPLDTDALIMHFMKQSTWVRKKFPIEYIDDAGRRQATWPARFPLDWIDIKKSAMLEAGEMDDYMREYMCEPEDAASKPFTSTMFKVTPSLTRTWEPCYAIYDPARTTKQESSAHTGHLVVSWISNRIVVWESGGEFWKPDEIVADMFRVDKQFNPIAIGVEIDGLNEFLMQPIRHEQMRRGHPLPIRALKAPKNKIDFIKGLQPFARAGEIILAGEQPQLMQQFDAFPRGRIDIPNALAYILKIKMGQPMFPSFGYVNVSPELAVAPRTPLYLAVNADVGSTTAALIQIVGGALWVHADWLSESPPGECLDEFVRAAGMACGEKFKVITPAAHYTGFSPLGMIAAARKIPVDLTRGGDERIGREEIRALIEKQPKGQPGMVVSQEATWTLRAMTGGYAKGLEKDGRVSEEATANAYKTLMEGVESLMALTRLYERGGDNAPRIAHTSDGRTYISARVMPQPRS